MTTPEPYVHYIFDGKPQKFPLADFDDQLIFYLFKRSHSALQERIYVLCQQNCGINHYHFEFSDGQVGVEILKDSQGKILVEFCTSITYFCFLGHVEARFWPQRTQPLVYQDIKSKYGC